MSSHTVSTVSRDSSLAKNIPVNVSDTATLNNSYDSMGDLFKHEMKLIDEHMTTFSSNLMDVYSGRAQYDAEWNALKKSPLVVDEGQGKFLRLQFDVSQFEVEEINVRLLNDMLIITASHEENKKDTRIYRKFDKQFKMPPNTNPDSVSCSLSTDGVLTIVAPLPIPNEVSLGNL